MANFFILVPLVLFTFNGMDGCKENRNNNDITAVEVQVHDTFSGDDFYRVYRRGDYELIQSHLYFDSSVVQFYEDSVTGEISSKPEFNFQERRKTFFIYHKDSTFGYMYGPTEDDRGRRKIDSMLKIVKIHFELEKFIQRKPDSSFWSSDKNELTEVYLFPALDSLPSYKTIFYFSNKMNHLKETFSTFFDSARKRKLYKIEGITDAFYSERQQMHWPSMSNITEMKQITPENPAEILSYFERYSKMK